MGATVDPDIAIAICVPEFQHLTIEIIGTGLVPGVIKNIFNVVGIDRTGPSNPKAVKPVLFAFFKGNDGQEAFDGVLVKIGFGHGEGVIGQYSFFELFYIGFCSCEAEIMFERLWLIVFMHADRHEGGRADGSIDEESAEGRLSEPGRQDGVSGRIDGLDLLVHDLQCFPAGAVEYDDLIKIMGGREPVVMDGRVTWPDDGLGLWLKGKGQQGGEEECS